jgi:hypothetical protein
MAKPFEELRERLLRAGVASRSVRRYLSELDDHLADLQGEEQSAGRSRADAELAALQRLGGVEELAKAMTEQRQFQSWCVRAPWAVFGLGPLALLATAWFAALLLLWFGWQHFLPGVDTPFGRHPVSRSMFSLANLLFQGDMALYYGAPILVGWGVALLASSQRLKVSWPVAGLVLTAIAGGMAQVHAGIAAVPGGLGHIRIDFPFQPAAPGFADGVLQALVIFSITALPYLVWQGGNVLPLTMSLTALTMVLVAAAIGFAHGGQIVRDTDEGGVAHIWQLLMTVQMPIVVFFVAKWLRRAPGQTLGVLALQAGAWLASCAPIYFLHL